MSKSSPGYPDCDFISAWRISSNKSPLKFGTKPIIYRAKQCLDSDGPMLAPDVYGGQDAGSWPHCALQKEHIGCLASSNSTRLNGRHYALACHHYHLPKDCWVLDLWCGGGDSMDICVDLATVGKYSVRQSMVMIRNLVGMHINDYEWNSPLYRMDWEDNVHLFGLLNHIAFANTLLHQQSGNGGAVRSKTGDVGVMYALGTGVDLDGISLHGYAANYLLPERLLRNMVKSLAMCGQKFFPLVLAALCDAESDTGIHPICPMEGDPHKGLKAGFTMDTSVNLGNSLHFDVHDASQGFGVWTEKIPGWDENWFFIMPNVYSRRPHKLSDNDGEIPGGPYAGLAIKLRHGMAMSWDGRVIRHCTSLSHPDGLDYPRVSGHGAPGSPFLNGLYGTFTAAKEKVVKAGGASCLREYLAEENKKRIYWMVFLIKT